MTNYKDQLYLQHFGVIGMKWGQRRTRIKALKKHEKQIKRDWRKAKDLNKYGHLEKSSDKYKAAKAARREVRIAWLFLRRGARARALESMKRGTSKADSYLAAYGRQAITHAAVMASANVGRKIVNRAIGNSVRNMLGY